MKHTQCYSTLQKPVDHSEEFKKSKINGRANTQTHTPEDIHYTLKLTHTAFKNSRLWPVVW